MRRRVWAGVPWLTTILAVLGGCAGPRMKTLSEKRFPERPASHPVELYAGGVQTSHEGIAILDSVAVELLTTDTRKLLVEDLRERARKVGADAVTDVTMLVGSQRGWVPDPQTPFRSWRQGWRNHYFLRGRAVRFKPALIETGESGPRGERFDFGEGERPVVKSESRTEIEVFEITDPQGRRGYGSRPKGRLPTIEKED